MTARYGLSRKDLIYITEQTTPLFALLKSRFFPGLVGSEYLGSAYALGQRVNNVRNEDMTRLTFPDDFFSAVLTFDVLEHIPDYARALREVFRCLQPGGRFLMTAPFDPNAIQTLQRAEITESGEIRHLLPPEYHGDPVNPKEGILCFQTFGWDLLEMLREIGFIDVALLDYWCEHFGYLGSCLVIEGRKPVR
jgi:SAM-dependent methyltransferase